MLRIGEKYYIIHHQYILYVEHIGINKTDSLHTLGDDMFKIIKVLYNRQPDIYTFTKTVNSSNNLYYGNAIYLFSEKDEKRNILSEIFSYF